MVQHIAAAPDAEQRLAAATGSDLTIRHTDARGPMIEVRLTPLAQELEGCDFDRLAAAVRAEGSAAPGGHIAIRR